MNTENLGPSYLSNLCFQFLATFLTWLWTFWLCPSLFSCLCLKNPFSDPKHTGIAFPKSQGSCVSLLVSKMITAWKFVIIQPFHFKVIQIPINLLLSKVQLVRQVITCRLPLSKLSLYFMVFRCSSGMDLSEKMLLQVARCTLRWLPCLPSAFKRTALWLPLYYHPWLKLSAEGFVTSANNVTSVMQMVLVFSIEFRIKYYPSLKDSSLH